MLLGVFAKLRKATVTATAFVCLSGCLYGTTLLPPDEFSYFILGEGEGLNKICRENSSLVKSDKKNRQVKQMHMYIYDCLLALPLLKSVLIEKKSNQ